MGVAGALVSEARGLVFTSNHGENTVSACAPCDERNTFKIAVGVKPKGLAFDPTRGILIAANVGDPSIPDSRSVSVVDLGRRERIAEVKVPHAFSWTQRGSGPTARSIALIACAEMVKVGFAASAPGMVEPSTT